MSNQTKAAGGLLRPRPHQRGAFPPRVPLFQGPGAELPHQPHRVPPHGPGLRRGSCKGVIEVGPGIGVLTWELSQVAEKVCAIELDSRLFPVLEETLAGRDNVKIIPGDVMKLDLHQLIQQEFGGGPVCVCANLPYYITSPVILRLLEEGLPLTSITVMVQKEAAQRLCAAPGERECGAVSVAVHYRSQPKLLFQVGRGSFLPSPKVDSAVLRLDLRQEPPVSVADEDWVFPGLPGRLCPAAEDGGQFPLRHSGAPQAPGGAGPGGRWGGGERPGRALPGRSCGPCQRLLGQGPCEGMGAKGD